MINKISRRISKRMVINHTILEEEEELYEYGLYQGILMIVNWITALCIGMLMNMIWQSVVLLLFFIPIRTFAGGFHASSPRICYIYSTLMQIGALCILNTISFPLFMDMCIIIITIILLIFLSPVETQNKPLDGNEIKRYKKLSIRNWSFELLFWIIFYMFGLIQIADCIIMSYILISILLIAGTISNRIRAK